MASFTEVYSKREFKNDIIIIQESDPGKFQEYTCIETRKLILEEECQCVKRFNVCSDIEILKIEF